MPDHLPEIVFEVDDTAAPVDADLLDEALADLLLELEEQPRSSPYVGGPR
jgi:hypothetical protein